MSRVSSRAASHSCTPIFARVTQTILEGFLLFYSCRVGQSANISRIVNRAAHRPNQEKYLTMKNLALLSVLLLVSSFLYAQSTNGSITGRVTDPGKAVLPGAKILLINTDTNVNRTVKTDSVGSYHIANVQPGNYRIEVEQQGFRTVIKPAISVHIQDA